MKIEDHLTRGERAELQQCREDDVRMRLTAAQAQMAAELQRALKQLPLEVIRNHLYVALRERGDLTHEEARILRNLMSEIEWEFI